MSIEVDHISKRFGNQQALDNISFSIRKGEVVGFLGPNGAGKTSLIKILMGLSHPTSGDAEVFGRPPREARTKANVGCLPESPYFYEYLSAAEFLELSARLSAVPRSEIADRVDRTRGRHGGDG